jgi:hypothetical protein
MSLPNRHSPLRWAHKLTFAMTRALRLTGYPEYMRYSLHDYSIGGAQHLLAGADFELLCHDFFGLPVLPRKLNGPIMSPLMVLTARRRTLGA